MAGVAYSTENPQHESAVHARISAVTFLVKWAIVPLVALSCVGCSGGKTEPPKATPSGGTASASQAPTAVDPERSDGTAVDPCWVPRPQQLDKWGVKRQFDYRAGSPPEVVRGCLWSGAGWTLNLMVSNKPLSNYLNPDRHHGAQKTQVSGLPAVTENDAEGCYVYFPVEKSTFMVSAGTNEKLQPPTPPDLCTKAFEIANDIAPMLPK